MSKLLHSHPELQRKLNLDKHHVIVDRDEWETARKTLRYLHLINLGINEQNALELCQKDT